MARGTLPRVALINSITGLGRCGVTAQLPVLSCMGVQACPMPTAMFSAPPGIPDTVYEKYDGLSSWVNHWVRCGVRFDGLLSGRLVDRAQAAQVLEVCERLMEPGSPFVLAPTLVDMGAVQLRSDPSMIETQRSLCGYASLIVCNLTEACLLTKTQHPQGPCTRAQIATLARRLLDLKPGGVVVTGISVGGGQAVNIAASANDEDISVVTCRDHAIHYAGAGDFFAAALLGRLVRGVSLTQALVFASGWTAYAAERTQVCDAPPTEGLALELILPLLATTGSGSPVDADGGRTVQFIKIDEPPL